VNVKEYLRDIAENLEKLGMKQEHFITMQEAMNWIQAENDKNAVHVTL
jgi:hypothetical protein